MEPEPTRAPIGRMLTVAVVASTVTAVVVTFAQKLLVGDANPAVTAGVTGAITAVLVTQVSRATPTCDDSAN